MRIQFKSQEQLNEFLEQRTVGSLLLWLCQNPAVLRGHRVPLSYAELARSLNYKSRSYVREVAEGHKMPNSRLLERLVQFLELNQTFRAYLQALYQEEQLGDEGSSVATKASELRSRIRRSALRKEVQGKDPIAHDYLESPDAPAVFAGLGSRERGSTPAEISKKTGLQISHVSNVLRSFVLHGIAELREGHYFARDQQVLIENLGREEVYHRDIEHTLKVLLRKNDSNQISNDELAYISNFCVPAEKMPLFKKRLSDLLNEFVVSSESSEGNQVVTLASFFTFYGSGS